MLLLVGPVGCQQAYHVVGWSARQHAQSKHFNRPRVFVIVDDVCVAYRTPPRTDRGRQINVCCRFATLYAPRIVCPNNKLDIGEQRKQRMIVGQSAFEQMV